jgi:DNA-binding ferritin-like protein
MSASGRAACQRDLATKVRARYIYAQASINTDHWRPYPLTNQSTAPPKEGLFRELLYIHSILRRDLRTVRRLADEARDGMSRETILDEIRNLETNSPLWQLKFGCMYYCRFVHSHHTIEDAALFPTVRKHDPSLNSVVDRLEEDHLKVHHITERIAAVADEVTADVSGAKREELVEALTELEEHLLAHLTFEEESIGPLLSTWTSFPVE